MPTAPTRTVPRMAADNQRARDWWGVAIGVVFTLAGVGMVITLAPWWYGAAVILAGVGGAIYDGWPRPRDERGRPLN